MRSSFILALATALVSSSLVARSDAQQLCNGYAELCAKTYDQVSYATTHNAYASNTGALAANQDNNISIQLKDGIRALMLDAYNTSTNDPNEIELCHTSCSLLDAGPLTKTLGQIKAFLDANPNEVVTIFWENAGNLTPAHFQNAYQAAGVTNYLYTQTTGSTTWPTLADMISSGKRLVNYVDSGADASVPWLMAEYDFVFETPFEIALGAAYLCTVDRPKDQRKQMYVMNHFISRTIAVSGVNADLPQPGAADQTNGPDLVSHANSCQSTFNQIPTFVAVDFYEKGSLLQTVAQLNGVTFNNKLPTQPASSTTSGALSAKSIISARAVSAAAIIGATSLLAL
ncbi:hypothetical protein BGZ99_003337 [Dissophora globulifera]|uniref:PLC-like phosphodiesterase n=1 Tax=Dissophora globulifera TaxID=979702 RepID=A0A9P6RKW7_9FUNG|nr:hypothetical protein BGZ99_003337 [Dissophora globulifera]